MRVILISDDEAKIAMGLIKDLTAVHESEESADRELRLALDFGLGEGCRTLDLDDARTVIGVWRELIAVTTEPESDEVGLRELALVLKLAKMTGDTRRSLVESVSFTRRMQGLDTGTKEELDNIEADPYSDVAQYM